MNIPLFGLLRRISRLRKARLRARAGRYLSVCRRIECVYPPAERVCAMTFDDGPSALPTAPDVAKGRSLTAHLLDVLARSHAHATFDVIGSTAENYPDTAGEIHTHFVFGRAYDHYARFEQDDQAGALACACLLRRLTTEGHEPANHGYRHVLFGPNRTVYRSRRFFRTADEVLADLTRLHTLVERETGVGMTLARPPHYVDRIPDGHNAYDVYASMGYHYLAASVDGGGWQPSRGSYEDDVEDMVVPLRTLLRQDPNALRGAVIFQKDGYNMSCQTPIASALPRQLALLAEYGYRVVSVSQLLALSPFADLPPDDPCFAAAAALDRAGHAIGYKNNTFQPDRTVTRGELCFMAAPRAALADRRPFVSGARATGFSDIPGAHPYAPAAAWARETGLFTGARFSPETPAAPAEIRGVARALGADPGAVPDNSRRAAVLALWGLLIGASC
ncbi:MAG: polysaccharide deacetylase family protein [Oscillospiraceae bacterium]|jgi:peptidoglycan/xylan/chitin deacetylase (PgdA/CDA1 family)|nr:polysaccharide deacetylase family protein [Oscillospiraceae bacterium]